MPFLRTLSPSIVGLICIFSMLGIFPCQRVETVEGPGGKDSCNVVNVHFGSDQEQTSSVSDRNWKVGAPGKKGPQGPVGPTGLKGQKGENGARGEGSNERKLKQDIINMIGAESCEELMNTHGIAESGYYLMKANTLNNESPSYRYCNFKLYTDPYTCHQLSVRDGIRESGLYELGPPGNKFEVYCNFFSGQAVTEIWHDSMDEIKVASTCGGRGCFTRTPVYKVSVLNMGKIIENSRECRQYIKMRCQGSALYFNGDPHAWWVSSQGKKMLYWGGAVSKKDYHCACGETGTCVKKAEKCNCDNNGNVMTQDEGYLTDKTELPVREMKFGDVDDKGEQAWHTLGKLECTGHEI